MKKMIWKIRYAARVRKLIGMSWKMAWGGAESALENLNYDLSECPFDAAQEESYAWAADSR